MATRKWESTQLAIGLCNWTFLASFVSFLMIHINAVFCNVFRHHHFAMCFKIFWKMGSTKFDQNRFNSTSTSCSCSFAMNSPNVHLFSFRGWYRRSQSALHTRIYWIIQISVDPTQMLSNETFKKWTAGPDEPAQFQLLVAACCVRYSRLVG